MSTKDEVEMIISVNGDSTKIPPGFRFHPTEEELLLYYLTKKIASREIDLDVIRDIDLNKLEPWDIQEKCKIGSGPQNDWYLFSHKDKKYPTGTRTNRATSSGFWKATGRDKVIRSSFKRIGMRKTLVFYKGRAPHGRKSDWIMHEYRLELDDVHTSHHHANVCILENIFPVNNLKGDSGSEEGWVVCRVFKKKDNHKKSALDTTSQCSSSQQQLRPSSNAKLDHILQNKGKFRRIYHKYETKNVTGNNFPSNDTITQAFNSNIFNIPMLDHVSAIRSPFENSILEIEAYNVEQVKIHDSITSDENDIRLNDWVTLDRLLASQLNGQHNDTPSHFSCYDIDLQDDVSFAQIDNVSDLSNPHSSKSIIQEVYNNNIWSYNTQSRPLVSSSSDALSDLSI